MQRSTSVHDGIPQLPVLLARPDNPTPLSHLCQTERYRPPRDVVRCSGCDRGQIVGYGHTRRSFEGVDTGWRRLEEARLEFESWVASPEGPRLLVALVVLVLVLLVLASKSTSVRHSVSVAKNARCRLQETSLASSGKTGYPLWWVLFPLIVGDVEHAHCRTGGCSVQQRSRECHEERNMFVCCPGAHGFHPRRLTGK